jgi:hypothetical protein
MDNRTANRIVNLCKVSRLEMIYRREEGWLIFGQPVSTGWPKADMVWGKLYKLGAGPTLEEAAKAALAFKADPEPPQSSDR